MIVRVLTFTAILALVPQATVAQGAARRERPAAPRAASTDSDQKGQPAVSAEPQETSATFGDWAVRCDRVQEQAATARVCEVAEALVVRASNFRSRKSPLVGRRQPMGRAAPNRAFVSRFSFPQIYHSANSLVSS